MDSQCENAYQSEEGAPSPCSSQLEQEHSESCQILETMRNLIIEIQSFKADNEKLKKAWERWQEINQIMLQSLQEKNNGEKPKTEIGKEPKVTESAKRKDISFNGTQKYTKNRPLGRRI